LPLVRISDSARGKLTAVLKGLELIPE